MLLALISVLPSLGSAQMHTLTITQVAQGMVSSSATVPVLLNTANIACGTDNRYGSSLSAARTTRMRCSRTYAANTQVTLFARANHPNHFIGWTGDCSGTDSQLTLTMDRDRSCRAVFAKPDGYVQIDASVGTLTYRAEHICAVTGFATIHCWGTGTSGQIGDGMSESRDTPTAVSGIDNAIAVSTGGLHTCAVLANGAVRCWGLNNDGQLGDGTRTPRSLPTAVSDLSNAISVSAGTEHTCAVLANGQMRCWGRNDVGQIGGDGGGTTREAPVAVSGITNAIAATAGTSYSCAVLDNGIVQCWGTGFVIGHGDPGGFAVFVPTTTSDITNAVAISAGQDQACAVLADGEIRCWGEQKVGQLGNGVVSDTFALTPVTTTGITTAVAVSTGNAHACAVLRDGQAKCWGASGANSHSRSGNGAAQARLGTGSTGGSATPVDVANLRSVASIAAGRLTSCALLRDGLAYCWGSDANGAVGNGAATNAAGYTTPQLVAGQSMTPASLQRFAVVGFEFAQQLKLANPASSWTINPISLPAGLRFDSDRGAVYGVPTAASAGRSYTISGGSNRITLQLTVGAHTDYTIRQTGNPQIPEHSSTGTEVSDLNLQVIYRPSNTVVMSGVSWSISAGSLARSDNPFLVTADGTVYVGRNTNTPVLDYERRQSADYRYEIGVDAELGGAPIFADDGISIRTTNVFDTLVTTNTLFFSATPSIRRNAEPNEPVGGLRLVGRETYPNAPPLNGLTWTLTGNNAFIIGTQTGVVRVANSLTSFSTGHSVIVAVRAAKDGITSDEVPLTITVTGAIELLRLHIKLFLEGPLQ